MSVLDDVCPPGDPGAVRCRHCGTGRDLRNGVLSCWICDRLPLARKEQ